MGREWVVDPMSQEAGRRMAEDAQINEWESVADAWEANRQRVFDSFRNDSHVQANGTMTAR